MPSVATVEENEGESVLRRGQVFERDERDKRRIRGKHDKREGEVLFLLPYTS